jgi:hypothetical protein
LFTTSAFVAQQESAQPKKSVEDREVGTGEPQYQDNPDPLPFINALVLVRHFATRKGACFQYVQAISVAIDQ